MADRYWVGGSGTWDTTSTTHWSDTSGGTAGASVPTASDNVIFNPASGSNFTVTMTGALACLDFTVADAFSMEFATGTAPTLAISGSMTFNGGVTWNSTGTITWNATSSKTIKTQGITFNNTSMIFNGVGGTWVMQDNLFLGATATLTNGTLDLGIGNILTCAYFSSSNANTRTLAFGGGFISCNGPGGTMFTTATVTGLTVTGNNPMVRISNSTANAATVATGALSEANSISFEFNLGTYTLTFLATAGYTARNIDFTGFAGTWAATSTGTIYGSLTLSSGMTLTASASVMTFAGTSGTKYITHANKTIDFSLTFNGAGSTWILIGGDYFTMGSTRTLTLTAGTFSQGAILQMNVGFLNLSGSTTRTFRMSYIELYGAGGTLFTAATSTNLTVTDPDGGNTDRAIRVSYGGASAVTIASGALSESNSISFQFVVGSFTLTFLGTAGYTARNVLFSGFTGTWGTTAACTIYGSYSHDGYSTLPSSASVLTFAGTSGTKELGNAIFDCPVTFNGIGSTWNGNLTVNSPRTITLTNGTMNFALQSTAAVVVSTGTVYLNESFQLFFYGTTFTHTSGTVIFNTSLHLYLPYNFTAGTLNLNDAILTVNRFVSSGSGTRTIAFGTSGSIRIWADWPSGTVTNPVWDTATVTGLTTTGNKVVNIDCGSLPAQSLTVNTGAMTEAQALSFVFDDNPSRGGTNPAETYTLTFLGTAGYTARDITFSPGSYITWAATAACTIYGGLTLTSTMTLTASTSTMTFGGTGLNGAKYIACWGKTLDFPIVFNGIGSTWGFGNDLIVGSTRSVTLTNGTFDYNTGPNITGAASVIMLTGTFTLGTETGVKITNGIPFTHTSGTLILSVNTTFDAGYTLTAGTLNLNNNNLFVTSFNASGATARTIAFGTGYIECTGTGLVWTTATITNLTITGTPLVRINNITTTAVIITPGALALASSISFYFISAGAYELTFLATAGNTVRDVTFENPWSGTWNAIAACTIYGNLTLSPSMIIQGSASALTFGSTSSKTITTGGKPLPFPITFNGVGGTWVIQDYLEVVNSTITLTAGTLNLNNNQIATTFFSSSGSTARTIAFGTSGYFNILGATGTVYTTATPTNLTITGTSNVQINPSAIATITVATGASTEAQSVNFYFCNSYGCTLTFLGTAGYSARDVDFTNFSGTWNATSTGTIYGSLTLGGAMTLTASTSAMTFGGTSGTKTIITGSKTIDFPLTFNGAGSTWRLLDALTMGITRTLTHTNGTIDLFGNALTVGASYTTAAGTKQLIFGNAALYCPAAGATAFNNAVSAGFSIGDATGQIILSNAAAKTFVGGVANYPIGLVATGGGTFTLAGNNSLRSFSMGYANTILITGSNTFRNFETNYVGVNSITLTSGTVQYFDIPYGNSFLFGGTGATIASSVAGSPAFVHRVRRELSGGVGNNIIVTGGSSVRDIAFVSDVALTTATIDGNGTVPSRYFATSCTNLGGNYGVLFSGWTSANQVSTIVISNTAATTWNPPADWNSANNIVHIFGAGGGGAGARLTSTTNKSGGGGGGGGGYTKILNYSATVGTPVSVTIGVGGSGGAATVNGTAGGNTVFGIYSANGGAGGTTTATPTAPGGAGGTGATFNGGTGGNGANTIVLNAGAGGGGGGGGGGLSGNGGNGGNGFASATAAQNAGGGGGGNGGGTSGANGASTKGGNGGNGASGTGPTGGTGAGPSANTATGAGGAGGASTGTGGSGAFGSDILGTYGGSGGMGASATVASSGTAFFGGGGGAGGGSNTTIASAGSNGGRGFVVIQYYPTAAYGTPSTTGSFFSLF